MSLATYNQIIEPLVVVEQALLEAGKWTPAFLADPEDAHSGQETP